MVMGLLLLVVGAMGSVVVLSILRLPEDKKSAIGLDVLHHYPSARVFQDFRLPFASMRERDQEWQKALAHNDIKVEKDPSFSRALLTPGAGHAHHWPLRTGCEVHVPLRRRSRSRGFAIAT